MRLKCKVKSISYPFHIYPFTMVDIDLIKSDGLGISLRVVEDEIFYLKEGQECWITLHDTSGHFQSVIYEVMQ
jgi:hypothetical protein